jgi:hypothetical protein
MSDQKADKNERDAIYRLSFVRSFLNKPEKWCQGKDRFRDAFSLNDALVEAGVDDEPYKHNRDNNGDYPGDLKRSELPDAVWLLRQALNESAPEYGGLINKWHDAPGRTYDEVINLLVAATRLLEDKYAKEDQAYILEECKNPFFDMPSVTHPNNRPHEKLNVVHVSGHQCGMFNLPVHYTMGKGLPEELGEDLDIAVFLAFREAAWDGNKSDLNHSKFSFKRRSIAVDTWWDDRARCVCLHLEICHSKDLMDWDDDPDEWNRLEEPTPQVRSIN